MILGWCAACEKRKFLPVRDSGIAEGPGPSRRKALSRYRLPVVRSRRRPRVQRSRVQADPDEGPLLPPSAIAKRRPHISVSRSGQASGSGASPVAGPCIAEWGWSRQRMIGLVRRRAGLPMMCVEIAMVSMPRRARPDRQLDGRCRWSGSGGRFGPWSGAVGGDGGVPPLAGGDHGVQVPQDRRGDDGLGLGGPQLVVLAGGQVAVAGGVDGVCSLGSPDRAPGGQP